MANILQWETLRTLDTSTMTNPALYYAIGTPLLFPSYKVKVVNTSNVLVTISINGSSDIDVAPSNSFFLYDETIQLNNGNAIPKGTQFYAKSASAGSGASTTLYLVSQYLQ